MNGGAVVLHLARCPCAVLTRHHTKRRRHHLDNNTLARHEGTRRLAERRYSRSAGGAMSELTLIAGIRGKIEFGS